MLLERCELLGRRREKPRLGPERVGITRTSLRYGEKASPRSRVANVDSLRIIASPIKRHAANNALTGNRRKRFLSRKQQGALWPGVAARRCNAPCSAGFPTDFVRHCIEGDSLQDRFGPWIGLQGGLANACDFGVDPFIDKPERSASQRSTISAIRCPCASARCSHAIASARPCGSCFRR